MLTAAMKRMATGNSNPASPPATDLGGLTPSKHPTLILPISPSSPELADVQVNIPTASPELVDVQVNIPTQLGQESHAFTNNQFGTPFRIHVAQPLEQPLPMHHVVQNIYLPYIPSQLRNYEDVPSQLYNYLDVHGNHILMHEPSAKVSGKHLENIHE